MKIEYTKQGDYYFPNLYLDSDFKYSEIGKYGRMRLKFLKENKRFKKNALKSNL